MCAVCHQTTMVDQVYAVAMKQCQYLSACITLATHLEDHQHGN